MTARLSIPGNFCVYCGTKITQELECEGCGWIDPLTISVIPPEDSHCSKCRDNTIFEFKDGEWLSVCCVAKPIPVDVEPYEY